MNRDIPKHIAIIMDGNGRWAKSNNKTRLEGHRKGVHSVRSIIQKSLDVKIKTLSLYTFSKDNWKRPKKEIDGLMLLFAKTIQKEFDNFNKNDIKVSFIGDIDSFPDKIKKIIVHTIKNTSKNKSLNLNIALGYSGRQEIVYAFKTAIKKIIKEDISINDITEDFISQNLYKPKLGDPDLLIRTGGEFRVSDFMLWQIAYSEIFFTDKYWPDFNQEDFLNAINDYMNRERRYGKISEQII